MLLCIEERNDSVCRTHLDALESTCGRQDIHLQRMPDLLEDFCDDIDRQPGRASHATFNERGRGVGNACERLGGHDNRLTKQ